ncbi:proline rich transmembrane protein 1B-like [Nelusetta ayraudi]|uniref:proline rich transmembrane protein 1B-like n=1 Tax=Nelusetta ayraudi TaxID=303726 RepID=UPI003F6FB192
MAQSAPPPYYDNLGSGQGYNQFSQVYPPQMQGYGDQLQTGPVAYGQQQYQAQPSVIMAQPNVYVSQGPLNPPVNDYIGYSIFTLMCCCLPLGIIALIYSTSARQANLSGNRPQAEQASRTARMLNNLAFGTGILALVFALLYSVAILFAPPLFL